MDEERSLGLDETVESFDIQPITTPRIDYDRLRELHEIGKEDLKGTAYSLYVSAEARAREYNSRTDHN